MFILILIISISKMITGFHSAVIVVLWNFFGDKICEDVTNRIKCFADVIVLLRLRLLTFSFLL